MNEIFDALKAMITKRFKKDLSAVTLETEVIKGLGADSLDMVEILMDIEEKYGIEFDDDDITDIVTVGDVVNAIIRKTAK